MKILQVAPLHESVPPKMYGGTERVVSYLTEELVAEGHKVTLLASGDSVTAAELIPATDHALRMDDTCKDPLAHHMILLDRVAELAPGFDVIHFHTDYLHFPLARLLGTPHVTTLHGRLDLPDLQPLYRHFSYIPLISISNEQRRPLPMADWRATVYNGVPQELYRLHPEPGDYLAFIGRISREKRVDRAIEIALRAGMPLKIAAKIDACDREYFDTQIKPLLQRPDIEYLGEIRDADKDEFLGNARALLFPIDWPEPFGLVMIEAMACGTPVVAYRCGSVPEVIRHGVTGFIVEDTCQAATALERLDGIDRATVREEFEKRFSARRMAHDYLACYQAVINHDDLAQGAA